MRGTRDNGSATPPPSLTTTSNCTVSVPTFSTSKATEPGAERPQCAYARMFGFLQPSSSLSALNEHAHTYRGSGASASTLGPITAFYAMEAHRSAVGSNVLSSNKP